MKKIVLAALTATSALIAMPAAAQTVSGDVTITGSVAPKCLVVTGGTPSGSTFAGTIALGELAGADGRLRTNVEASFDTAAAALNFQVVCTSGNTSVTVDANPIVALNVPTAPTGYARSIDYQANVTFTLTPSGAPTVSNDSGAAPGSPTLLGGRLASGATNIAIDGANFRTANLTDLLVADTQYEGHILITIAPAS